MWHLRCIGWDREGNMTQRYVENSLMQLHVAVWDSVLFFSLCLLWQGQCWPTTDQSSIELFFFNWIFSFLFPLDMNVRGPGEERKASGRPVLRIPFSAPDVRYQIQNMSSQTLNLASYSRIKQEIKSDLCRSEILGILQTGRDS